MSTRWRVRLPGGETVGPIDNEAVAEGIATRSIPLGAVACRDGESDWVSVVGIADFRLAVRKVAPPPPSSAHAEASANSSPFIAATGNASPAPRAIVAPPPPSPRVASGQRRLELRSPRGRRVALGMTVGLAVVVGGVFVIGSENGWFVPMTAESTAPGASPKVARATQPAACVEPISTDCRDICRAASLVCEDSVKLAKEFGKKTPQNADDWERCYAAGRRLALDPSQVGVSIEERVWRAKCFAGTAGPRPRATPSTEDDAGDDEASAQGDAGSRESTTQVTAASDATSSAALAPDDVGFVDARGGAGWGDRCWSHLKAHHLDWAQGECERGLAIADSTTPQPRASLLYNLGLIAKERHDVDKARQLFQSSLDLRENQSVRAALESSR